MAGLDSSPGSIDDVEGQENHEEKKRQPVKRACNECRQQKVSLPLQFWRLSETLFHLQMGLPDPSCSSGAM